MQARTVVTADSSSAYNGIVFEGLGLRYIHGIRILLGIAAPKTA
ncbi:MAG: hypothetical protein AAGF83_15230 [Cyanobacteria bacterium P01_G01_bin.67]